MTTGTQRIHSFCDGYRCRCKSGFVQDFALDECRASLASTCIFGYVYENGTQKCRPSSKSDASSNFDSHPSIRSGHSSPLSSSLSALFWPVIAFFLVILLLKMLKEGMRRDCERAAATVASGTAPESGRRHRRSRSHHHHRSLGHHVRPFRHFPSELLPTNAAVLPSSGPSSSRSRAAEIIVLMPPPPYTPTAAEPEVSLAIGVGEEPPTYEEATRK